MTQAGRYNKTSINRLQPDWFP